jgi:hypothetical protein
VNGRARALSMALVLVVAGASGAYLLVYLYRWEWARAIVAGVFFLSAEVAFVALVLFDRIRAVERRITSPPGPAIEMVRAHRPVPPSPFEWLREPDRTGVFIPVLLGAGVILSAAAVALQRLAEHVTRATVEPRLAHDLDGLALPAGGLLPGRGPVPDRAALDVPPPPDRRLGRRLVALGAAAAALTIAVALVAEHTQSRPVAERPARSIVAVRIMSRQPETRLDEAVAALWATCEPRLLQDFTMRALPAGPEEAVLVVRPGLAPLDWRRLHGCLEDATLSDVQATASLLEAVP